MRHQLADLTTAVESAGAEAGLDPESLVARGFEGAGWLWRWRLVPAAAQQADTEAEVQLLAQPDPISEEEFSVQVLAIARDRQGGRAQSWPCSTRIISTATPDRDLQRSLARDLRLAARKARERGEHFLAISSQVDTVRSALKRQENEHRASGEEPGYELHMEERPRHQLAEPEES